MPTTGVRFFGGSSFQQIEQSIINYLDAYPQWEVTSVAFEHIKVADNVAAVSLKYIGPRGTEDKIELPK